MGQKFTQHRKRLRLDPDLGSGPDYAVSVPIHAHIGEGKYTRRQSISRKFPASHGGIFALGSDSSDVARSPLPSDSLIAAS
ncbi:MAG: hypothetical protein ABI132_04165 [Rhodanobacteraceae bacterium]